MSTKYSIGYKIVSAVLSVVLAAVSLPLSAFAMQNAVSFLESPVEIEDKRDAFTKTYLNPDNTYTAVMYPEQIHENTSGEWKDINNTLRYNGKTDRYENNSNPSFSVSFSQKADSDSIVSMSGGTDGETDSLLSWTIGLLIGSETVYPSAASFKSVEPEKNPDENTAYPFPYNVNAYAVYENAFEGRETDIRYNVSQNRVKEELVFNAPSDVSSVVSVFSSEGLSAVLNEDNTVSFVNSQGETEYTVHAPFVYDANGSDCPHVEITVAESEGRIFVTYTPDPEWLNSQERVYPVVFDPEITNKNYTVTITDTYTKTGSTTNNSSAGGIYVGHYSNKIYHGFLKFSAFPSVITNEVEIKSITLKMSFVSGTTTMSPIGIYPVTSSWTGSITYQNEPTVGNLISTGTVAGTYSSVTYNITDALAAACYTHSTSHNGFMFRYTDETNTNDYNIFASISHSSQTRRPLLTINYVSLTEELRIGDTYKIKNAASGKYLTVHNGTNKNGTNLYQYETTSDNGEYQKFILKEGSVSGTNTFLAKCTTSGTYRYVDVLVTNQPDYNPASGCNVQLWSGGYPKAQNWVIELVDQANHLYLIRLNYNTNLVLTSYGTGNGTSSGTSSTSSGNIFISTYSSGNQNQLWYLENTREYEEFDDLGYLTSVYDEYMTEDDLPLSVGDFFGSLSLYSGRATGAVYGNTSDDVFPIDTAFYVNSALFDGTDYYEYLGLYNGKENATHYLYPYGFTKLSYYEFLIPQYDAAGDVTAYRYVGNDGTSSFFVRQEENNTVSYVNDQSGAELNTNSRSFENGGITRTFDPGGWISSLTTEDGTVYTYVYATANGIKRLLNILISGLQTTYVVNLTATSVIRGEATENFTASAAAFSYGDVSVDISGNTVTVSDTDAEKKIVLTSDSAGRIIYVKERNITDTNVTVTYVGDLYAIYGKGYTTVYTAGTNGAYTGYYTENAKVSRYYFDVLNSKTTVVTYTDYMMSAIDDIVVYDNSENGSLVAGDGNRANLYGQTNLSGVTYGNMSLNTANRKYNSSSILFDGDTYSTSYLRKTVSVSAGTYTVSAYVKLDGLTSATGGLRMVTNLGGDTFESEYLTGTTPSDIGGGWQRISYTFTVPMYNTYYVEFRTDGIISGKAYVSAIQVEQSQYPTQYDLSSGVNSISATGKYTGKSYGYAYPNSSFSTTGTDALLLTAVISSSVVSPKLPGYTENNTVVDGSYAKFRVSIYYMDPVTSNMSSGLYEYEFDPFVSSSFVSITIPLEQDKNVVYFALSIETNRLAGTVSASRISVRETSYHPNEEENTDEGTTTEQTSALPNGNTQTVTTTVWNNGTFDNEILVVTETTDADGALLYSESVDTVYSAANVVDSVYTSTADYTTANTVVSESYTEKRNENGQFVSKSGTRNTSVYSTSVIDDYSADTLVSETTERLSLDSSDNVTARIITSTSYSTDSTTGNKTVTSTDERGNQTVTISDPDGNVLSVTYPTGTAPVYYTYNSDGKLSSTSQAGITDSFTYIKDSISTVTRSGNGSGSYTYAYDTNGNLTSVKVGTKTLVSYEYDTSNRLTKITYANGYYEQYAYDRYGMSATKTTSDGRIYTYRFDSKGRLYEEYDSDADERIRYEYDVEGNLLRKTVIKNGAISHTVEYTEDGTRYRDNTGTVFNSTKEDSEKTFDSLDRIIHEEYGASGSIEKNYAYVNNLDGTTTDLISSETFSDGGTFSYTYDGMGRILTVSENSVLKISYTYDSLGELVREDNAYSNMSYTWEYDGNGNVLNKKLYSYTTGMLGSPMMTNSYGYGDTDFKDFLTSYGGTPVNYDLSGNPLNWGATASLSWTGNRLVSITSLMGSVVTDYTYNAEGIRTSKTTGTTKVTEYLLDGTKIVKQTTRLNGTVTEELIFYYDTNEELIGFHYNGHDYFYGKDCTGIIRYIYDENGDIVVTYTYDAWGAPIGTSGTLSMTVGQINPYRYKDYYYDTETGFYYLQSRYYDPNVGRFISPDSVDYLGASGSVLSYNLFAYCENEPVQGSDSSGYASVLALGFQLAIQISKFVIGLEGLFDLKTGKFYLFLFIGGVTSNPLSAIETTFKNDLAMLRSYIPKITIRPGSLFSKMSISFSVVMVVGNRYAKFPESYVGWFTGLSFSFRHATIFGSLGRSGRTRIWSFGIGITTSTLSLNMSQTFYFQVSGANAFSNNTQSLIPAIKDKFAWLKLFFAFLA